MTAPSGSGVVLACERNGGDVAEAPCLMCGHYFVLDAAVLTVNVLAERIGFIGPCCLAVDALERYMAKCHEFEAQP